MPDTPFQGAPDARIKIRMIHEQLPQRAHRAYVVGHLENRHHVGLENSGQRIRSAPGALRLRTRGVLRMGLSRVPVDRLKPAFAAAGKLLFRVMNSLA